MNVLIVSRVRSEKYSIRVRSILNSPRRNCSLETSSVEFLLTSTASLVLLTSGSLVIVIYIMTRPSNADGRLASPFSTVLWFYMTPHNIVKPSCEHFMREESKDSYDYV